ncbi:MAG: hypothetical protein ACU0GG_21310 [Paracoccaceae bacterium]
MNPLLLLLGLFGAGALAFGGSSSSGSSTGTAAGSVDDPVTPPVDEPPADDPPADEPPADDPPADDPPADDPPADDPPADDPPADDPPADDPPADDPPADDPPADDPPADDPPADDPPADDPPADDPPADDPPADDPPADDPPADDPPADDPPADDPPADDPPADDPPADDDSSGGDTVPIIADGTVEVVAARVATLAPADDDVTDVRIVSNVQHGRATVNEDNTIALVMTRSDFTGNQSLVYEATHADGSVTQHEIGLNVVQGPQAGGWDTSEHQYMLATDDNDNIIVETGDNHTTVHISGAPNALSLADIAAMEGMSVGQVTGAFLANSGTYGQSEGMALAEDAGMALWREITPEGSETSNHLLLERGYEYNNLGRILAADTHGESELHTLLIGAYGDGDKPVVTERFFQYQEGSSNLVIQGIEFSDGMVFQQNGENTILDDVKVTGYSLIVMDQEGITVRNSEIIDVHYEEPNGATWVSHPDRLQGMYAWDNTGFLLDGNFFDMNGWEEGYNFSGDPDSPQPASIFSHNMYIDYMQSDLTMVDNISMRGASFGAQVRSGGFFEDNVFLENNAAFQINGGDYNGAGAIGSYSLANSNIITSGAHKEMDIPGAFSLGLADDAQLTTLVDNIVTHLADPDNMDEFLERMWANEPLRTANPYYNDTIIYNWMGSHELNTGQRYHPDQNIEGLDTNVLDDTTIQNFTAELTNNPDAAIDDLSAFIRQYLDGAMDTRADADAIVAYFQDGFGVSGAERTGAETLRFEPSDLGAGVRWDNRLNWDTNDLPGTVAGDSVDLGGNHVTFGGNVEINTLDLGPDGQLDFHHGRLEATGGIVADDAGRIEIDQAGQFWTNGSTGDASVDINVDGGRFVNTGDMQNVSLTATDGQSILATGGAEFDLSAGERLEVLSDEASVGFDGDNGGMAILDLDDESTVAFSAEDGDFASIAEFRSGTFGDAPNVQSGIDLGGSVLEIDLAGLDGSSGSVFSLMDSDELVGTFDDAIVSGLGSRDATVVVDYVNDTVRLELTNNGSGQVSIQTNGDQSDVSGGENALWQALTADQGVASETLSAGLPDDEDMPDLAFAS